MAQYNKPTAGPTLATHEGAQAKRISPEQEFRRTVMACLLREDTFYESGISIEKRIAEGVGRVGLDIAAAVAIEAREKMYLRHTPLRIVREMARIGSGNPIVADTIARVIQRADEIPELLAMYWAEGKSPISAQMKKGLARAFRKFNEYDLAKYNRDNAIKLRDVLFMVRPKAESDAQQDLWNRLVKDELAIPQTWENRLSAGQNKKVVWTEMLNEDQLGGLALLRNLRNMQKVGVDLSTIRGAIQRNRFKYVLPFRFIAAARYAPMLEDVLEEALFRGLEGTQKLAGRTALLLDRSGSMEVGLSEKSEMQRTDAAAGLGILLREICESVAILAFSDKGVMLPTRRGFALAEAYMRAPSGGTMTESAKQVMDRFGYDRIIIVTDEQSHQALSNPLTEKGYVINVAPYKNGIGYGAWTHIDGWSEAIVNYIQKIEDSNVPQ